MGDELEWLLKEGVCVFLRTLSSENSPPHSEVGPYSTARIVTSTSSYLASLACYLLPDRAHSHDSRSFAYVSSSSLCRCQRSCMSLAQPPILTRLVR